MSENLVGLLVLAFVAGASLIVWLVATRPADPLAGPGETEFDLPSRPDPADAEDAARRVN